MLELAADESTLLMHSMELSRLFEQYHGLVFRTAYRVTGNAADAEDILQTIFLRLTHRNAELGPVTGEESYFRRAAVNASIDLLRSRQKANTVSLAEHPDQSTSVSRELQDALRHAFSRLSPRSAEVFALRYFEDCTNQQIAKMLDMSQVLVAVTLHRARHLLQKEIRSYGGRS